MKSRKLNQSTILLLITSVFLFLGGFFLLDHFSYSYQIDNELEEIHKDADPCIIEEIGEDFLVTPRCLLEKQLPSLEVQEIVDLIRDDIIGFENIYQPFSDSFSYTTATPLFAEKKSLFPENNNEIEILIQAAEENKKIQISKKDLARQYVDTLSYYVADKNISGLRPCSKHNYLTALSTLDHFMFPPGEEINMNKKLSNLAYCRGRSEKEFLFYGGVCGSTSQLFRVALLHPNIFVIKRYPHNEWFTQYYGPEAGGDDAAIIEMSKTLELRNDAPYSIYFRTKNIDDKQTFLVAISPSEEKWVTLTRTRKAPLSVEIQKDVYRPETSIQVSSFLDRNHPFVQHDKSKFLEASYFFPSRYIKKNHESR